MNKLKSIPLAIICILTLTYSCKEKKKDDTVVQGTEKKEITKPIFEYQEVTGIGKDSIYNRRDNSDIIKIGDTYYIWYTRMNSPITSGYWGTIWYATSKDEGYTWTEQGMALGLGEEGAFDSHSVFTPNILAYKGKYYLYYTGVKPTPGNPDKKFENNTETDITALGLAVANSPDGPFKRVENNPILTVSETPEDFDSYRIDDTSMLVKDHKVWMYYKGRSIIHGAEGPKLTEMGVATILSLASISQSINSAKDGLHFSIKNDSLQDIPRAPGLYRPHLEEGNPEVGIPGWGIALKGKKGLVYFDRYEIK